MLELVFRFREDPVIGLGGLWTGVDDEEERERESGAGSGNVNDRLGLDFEEP